MLSERLSELTSSVKQTEKENELQDEKRKRKKLAEKSKEILHWLPTALEEAAITGAHHLNLALLSRYYKMDPDHFHFSRELKKAKVGRGGLSEYQCKKYLGQPFRAIALWAIGEGFHVFTPSLGGDGCDYSTHMDGCRNGGNLDPVLRICW